MQVRKPLEKTWFSLMLIAFICLGVFRVLEDPEKKLLRKSGRYYDYRTTEPPGLRSLGQETVNHVTKPLNLARNGTGFSDHVLLFNRVPKSGSEMLVLLLQWLQGANGFRHVRIPGGEKRKLSVLEQEEIVEQITNTEKAEAIPISFDRHVYFINFTKFDKQWPIYVNLVREPVEKAISRFYYGRVTPNYKNPDIRRAIAKGLIKPPKEPKPEIARFEECVAAADPECNFISGQTYDLTIPYFCGQETRCSVLNDKWALQKAKENVDAYFPVVGVLEDLNTTLAVLEDRLPIFFRGVQDVYFNELLEPHRNRNRQKPNRINKFVKSHLKNQLRDEYDLYFWLKSRLRQQFDRLNKSPKDRWKRAWHGR